LRSPLSSRQAPFSMRKFPLDKRCSVPLRKTRCDGCSPGAVFFFFFAHCQCAHHAAASSGVSAFVAVQLGAEISVPVLGMVHFRCGQFLFPHPTNHGYWMTSWATPLLPSSVCGLLVVHSHAGTSAIRVFFFPMRLG